MPIIKYEEITYPELQRLDRQKTVILLTVNPLMSHGYYYTQMMARALLEKKQEWNFVLIPTVFAGADVEQNLATVEVRPTVLRALVYSYCKRFAKEGFKYIIVVSGHAGPRHLVVLEEIASQMQWRHRVRMVSASSHFLTHTHKGMTTEQVLMTETVPLLDQFLSGTNVKKQFRSKFYYIPYLRTDFKWILIILVYAIAFGIAWWWLMHLMEVYR